MDVSCYLPFQSRYKILLSSRWLTKMERLCYRFYQNCASRAEDYLNTLNCHIIDCSFNQSLMVNAFHTRASKYNLSALRAYFECEGATCTSVLGFYLVTMETFVVQRSRSGPSSTVCTALENALMTNRKWKPTESDLQRYYNSDEQTDKQLP